MMTKKIKAVVWLAALAMTGCLGDTTEEMKPDTDPDTTDKVTVALQVPGMQTPATRAMSTANESYVGTLDLLVFDDTHTPSQLIEHHIIDAFTLSGGTYKFNLASLSKNSDITLAVVANAADAVHTALETACGGGSTWKGAEKQDVMNAMQFSCATVWPANLAEGTAMPVPAVDFLPIPMYGEAKLAGHIYDNAVKNVTLKRMLARVDIINNCHPVNPANIKAGEFSLQIAAFANFNTRGLIAPPFDANGELTENDPVMPNLPDGLDTGTVSYINFESDDIIGYVFDTPQKNFTNSIYIFETWGSYDPDEDPSTYNAAKPSIKNGAFEFVLGGEYLNDLGEIELGLFPVDFTYPHDSETGYTRYMPVLRNHKYVLNITAIEGSGHVDIDDLVMVGGGAVMSNLKTDILVYDESEISDFVFDGNTYLGLGKRELVIENWADTGYNHTEYTVPIATNYSHTIRTGIVYDNPEYDNWWLNIVSSNNMITVTSFSPHYGSKPRTATIYVEAGRITHSFTVTQMPAKVSNCYLLVPGETASIPYYVQMFRADYVNKRTVSNSTDFVIGLNEIFPSRFEAEIIWMDKQGVIQETELSTTSQFIYDAKLNITAGNNEGNAVVALKYDGVIKWSWHIWVCADKEAMEAGAGTDNQWMDRNVGAIMNAHDSSREADGMGLFYQWGRKDPFPAVKSFTNTAIIQLYNSDGTKYTLPSTQDAPVSILESIQNPAVFYTGEDPSNWTDENTGFYGWNDPSTSTSINDKSVFDPCPLGWKLPKSGIWKDEGWEWKNKWAINEQYGGYYPKGRRIGDFTYNNTSGFYQTSSPAGEAKGINMTFYSYLNEPAYSRTNAVPARCIKE